MELVKLTDNLTLSNIEANNWNDEKLLAVCCHFFFYGKHGTGYISMNKIDSYYPSFSMTEMTSDLSESFNEQIEEHWDVIVKHVKAFQEGWELKMKEVS